MRLTEAALRKIVREEIAALYEGRSNTFMLSRMEETELEEQDRDGDGDSDFDDVRVARFTASGMPKNKAVDKVKRKPLGTPPKKKVNEDVTALRVLVQELLMLNELQFQTGYTEDPRFSSPAAALLTAPADDDDSVAAPAAATNSGETDTVVGGDSRPGYEGRIQKGVLKNEDFAKEINSAIPDDNTTKTNNIKRAIYAIGRAEQGTKTDSLLNFNNNLWGVTGTPAAWGDPGTKYGKGTWKSTRDGKTTTYVNFDTMRDGILFMKDTLDSKGFGNISNAADFSASYSSEWVGSSKVFDRAAQYKDAMVKFP